MAAAGETGEVVGVQASGQGARLVEYRQGEEAGATVFLILVA